MINLIIKSTKFIKPFLKVKYLFQYASIVKFKLLKSTPMCNDWYCTYDNIW